MAILRPFPRFLAAAFAAPKAMLSRMKWTLDRHSDFLENVEGEDGVEVRRNYKGGITISAPDAAGAIAAAEYTSYFKLYDASDETTCKIGVKDGAIVGASEVNCGTVYVTGVLCPVAIPTPHAVTAGGSAWLYTWLDAEDGELAKVVFTNGDDPGNVEGGILYANQLLGRWGAASDGVGGYVLTAINQDYLKGGEHHVVLMGLCSGEAL